MPRITWLDAILAEIGRGCLQDGVATSQLHQIVFGETKIDVELYDKSGRSKVDNYPITAPILSLGAGSTLLTQRTCRRKAMETS